MSTLKENPEIENYAEKLNALNQGSIRFATFI